MRLILFCNEARNPIDVELAQFLIKKSCIDAAIEGCVGFPQ